MNTNKKEKNADLKMSSKDVGSSEVQIGFLSKKIENLTLHFKKNNGAFAPFLIFYGARSGIRTPDLLILTHYCFRSRRGSAFGVWTFSSPCRDH